MPGHFPIQDEYIPTHKSFEPENTPYARFKATLQDIYAQADARKDPKNPEYLHPERWKDYRSALQKFQKAYPEQFSQLQEKNTTAIEKVLNQAEFDLERYTDPVSKRGLKDITQRLNVPYGFENVFLGHETSSTVLPEGHKYSKIIIPIRGMFQYGKGEGGVDIFAPLSRYPEKTSDTIRHEGQHTLLPDSLGLHDEIYKWDAAYAHKRGDIDTRKILEMQIEEENRLPEGSMKNFDWDAFSKQVGIK